MKKETTKALWHAGGGLTGLLALLAIIVAANVIIGNVRLRADLTGEKLYSLTDGTRAVLDKLDQDVELKLFFNSSAPQVPVYLKNFARQVEDLLTEYRISSGGRITFTKYDPKPDSDAEEWAQRYGVSGQSTGMMGPPIYLGLVAVSGDNEAALPVLDPRTEELLEYNITRLIHGVCHPEKPVIGVMSSLPIMGMKAPRFAMPGQPPPQDRPAWIALQELGRDFETRQIETSVEEIDPDIDTLVVVHPKKLSEKTLFALDQFVLRGGRLLAMVDPFSLADMETQPQQNPYGVGQDTSSTLDPLFKAWGVGYDPAKVVVDYRAVTRVRGAGNSIDDSPVLLSMRADNISREDILTTSLESLLFPFAGAISDETSEDVTFTALVTSSDSAGTVDAVSARFGGQAIRKSFKAAGTPLHVAARLTGTFQTAFPDGPPAGEDESKDSDEGEEENSNTDTQEEAGHLAEGEGTILVVADTDFVGDRFCVESLSFFGTVAHRPMNDNLGLLANIVEQIAGSADLIGIRSRGRFHRPFDRVLALEQKARTLWHAKEDDLQRRLEETQRQLGDLQKSKDESQRFILSPDQQKAIENFRAQERQIKRELKEVRKNLRREIERLGITVKVINIAFMPLVVILSGVSYGVYRRRRR